jgi:lysyl-tRNA synthetase class 2
MSDEPRAQESAPQAQSPEPEISVSDLVADRRRKLERLRTEFNANPYGEREAGLITLADARQRYDAQADADHKADPSSQDVRPHVKVAGRVVLHRPMGNLIFATLRDHSGDLQVAVSKKLVEAQAFTVANKLTDLGDVVVAAGKLATTKTGEITLWVHGPDFRIASKSLAPPPGKWHGLQDAEQRYRKRYVDMYANPQVVRTFHLRSKIVSAIRRFMDDRAFLEVETPMLQGLAGGAAARPFVTHHNALDIDLFLRIAPELYLKRLLVGGLPRVYEINRNFRNEGIDRSHNPEFTSMEVYEAFGNYESMMELTESLVRHLALLVSKDSGDGSGVLPWDEHSIDFAQPFRRVTYADLFRQACGFAMTEMDQVRAKARELHLKEAGLDDWLVVNEVFEEVAERGLIQPTFVTDYPAAISPLTRPRKDDPTLCERWDLFIGEMESGTAYTELNDPDIQEQKFRQQLKGADEEEQTYRSLDDDFLEALRVGMPPAGGLGLGIDRLVMLLTNTRTIRDVILFPLMRPV